MNRTEALSRIATVKPKLTALGVSRVRVFGSFGRDSADAASDVDVILDFAEGRTPDLFAFAGLKLELERVLGRPVDLFTPRSIHPDLASRVLAEAVDA